MNITFFAPTHSVTGSCTLLESATTRVLIDCGTVQGDAQQRDFPFDPASIDAVVLTHGHLDHTGRVPELFEKGFRGKVYGQYATCDIARRIWEDSSSLSQGGAHDASVYQPETLRLRQTYAQGERTGGAEFANDRISEETLRLRQTCAQGERTGGAEFANDRVSEETLRLRRTYAQGERNGDNGFSNDKVSEETPRLRQTYALGERNGNAGSSTEGYGYKVPFQIGDITFTLYDAGHIMGSSHIAAESKGKRILFSGDIGPLNTPIIRDPFSRWQEPFDAVVIESTYGDRLHKDRSETVKEFVSIVKRTVKNRGVLLVPAFAVGRTQEMLYHLNTLVESGEIPAIPVFVDSPMAGDITAIYRRYREYYDEEASGKFVTGDNPLVFKGLNITQSAGLCESAMSMRPPFIIIAGSGMCSGGRILGHLKTFLPHDTTTVMIVGYQGRGTLGRELVNGADLVTINGHSVPVRASIATMGGFSAHADREGLLNWARAVPGEKIRWFVNHGEEKAARNLAEELYRVGRGEATVAENGASF